MSALCGRVCGVRCARRSTGSLPTMTRAEGLRCVVVGGGHNGLVAAGLLAKRLGAHVTGLERRSQVGGAAITETPWGPDFKVTALSYVVSLLPRTVLEELALARFGYHGSPQFPYFAPRRDGRYLMMCDEPARRAAEIAKFSARDAAELAGWGAWVRRLG